MKAFLLLFIVISLSYAEEVTKSTEKNGDLGIPIVCGICKSVVSHLEELLLGGAYDKASEYIQTLCAKADGVIEKICTKIFDYGLDDFLQLILQKAGARIVCTLVLLC
ncbi:Pore-forming peptide ameobapore C precursor, putative [Entamoeba invadens IP1]|uniref:Pore-forming peptide ameobapore C, putative n=1 Tax=Entamoeba invadens IP1 TaxID=370355 RepID=A0A0A1U1Z5_ENTIV|nr:Pore-forming peptide ameobapore C precursor, putative [Entamoeba invadens IP1]ELP88062.1 Pore-forming peptide ameobapore C precursor, putative [Entamoeba invadens IP1]|eukprot:XP_004254833.1 Pore-forming peptide ameobapore C precursor, putative [Entamoeba invadens IP1]